ncbi:hypothetical protein [Shewanella benthica]|uniref:Lipoprotein n=1 Tax=Shewanella benthica KT99 TaxID=314608 RepID=A9CWL6_9GAMM|nr:hypothetical protein [Shewanella benthica]EDQ02543.1 hypothetical protein KT99_18537 [Shewanella benthica KT99]
MARITRIGQAIMLSALLPLASLGVQASDRFNWSSNVWVQPTWSSSWGTGIGVGIGTGSPYWSNHSLSHGWNNSWYRPYWRNSWRYPYRYERYDRYDSYYYNERRAVKRQPTPVKAISAPVRVTTGVQYASGLKSLAENARVIQRDGRTIYEWQGVEYVFDWNTETYRELQ